jgi:hypothetical protein
MSKPTELWLWWITDEFGDRRMTTYRMPRQVALWRYPGAQPVPGTVEIFNLPDTNDAGSNPSEPEHLPRMDRP